MSLVNLLKSIRYRALSAIDGRHCSSFISPKDAVKHKKNDTLFIFGSGASALDGVKLISSTIDTMTINYSMFLPIDPNFVMYELPMSYDNLLYRKVMNYKIDKKALLLYRPSKRDRKLYGEYKLLFDNAINELRIPYKNSLYLKKMVKKTINKDKNYFLFYRVSIISAIFFAARLGYKDVYLWGIDLNGSKTFYQKYPQKFKTLFNHFGKESKGGKNIPHKTEIALAPGDVVIKHIQRLSSLLSIYGVTVHCITKKSALYGLGQDL